GIVRPTPVLPRIARRRSQLRVFGHPLFPVFFEIGAKFPRHTVLRGALLPLHLSQQHQRHGKKAAACNHCDHCHYPHYDSLPAAFAKSFSRSSASITISRAVSSASIAVLST